MTNPVMTSRDPLRGPNGEVTNASICNGKTLTGMLHPPSANQLKAAGLESTEWEEAAFIYLELEANAELDPEGDLITKFPPRKFLHHANALEFIEGEKRKRRYPSVGRFIRQLRATHDVKQDVKGP